MKTDLLRVLVLLLAAFGCSSLAQSQTTATGNLENRGCTSSGDIRVGGGARVNAPHDVECVTDDGEIAITELVVEDGAKFRAAAGVMAERLAATDCRAGDLDCNHCANNVVDQFNKLFSVTPVTFGERLEDDIRREWRFRPSLTVGPSERSFRDAVSRFDLKFPVHMVKAHVQGFARTNHPLIRYVGTYSHSDDDIAGSIFFVARTLTSERLELFAQHDAFEVHPGGISTLGNYVLFGDNNGERRLRVMNVANANRPQILSIGMNKDDDGDSIGGMGGGVGMAKLANGDYLLLMTQPGGARDKINPDVFFYRVSLGAAAQANIDSNPLATPSPLASDRLDWHLQFLGWDRVEVRDFAPFQEEYLYAENLSLISECGSGKIFVAHSNGLGDLGIEKKGYWRLSAVNLDGAEPSITPVAVYETNQNIGNCYLKAAATAWVDPEHRIELVCHEFRWSELEKRRLRFRTRAIKPE